MTLAEKIYQKRRAPQHRLPQSQMMPPMFTQKLPVGGDIYIDTGGNCQSCLRPH